jgi:hypothetical protein
MMWWYKTRFICCFKDFNGLEGFFWAFRAAERLAKIQEGWRTKEKARIEGKRETGQVGIKR